MYLLNNVKFNPDIQRTIGDTQYPPGWFRDPIERAKIGVIEVTDPVRPDDKLFSVIENADGTFTATARTAEEIALRSLPPSVTRYQGLIALEDAGLLTTVESAIANAPKKTQIAFSNAHVWRRASSMVSDMQAVLGMTDAEVDALFIAADAVD